MAVNKTAYANGVKITGSLTDVAAGVALYAVDNPGVSLSSNGDKVDNTGTYTGPGAVMRQNSIFKVRVPLEGYGNASAADVAKGKTFTSAAGLRVEGTNEGGGGEEVFWGGVNPTTSQPTVMYVRNMVYPHEEERFAGFSQCEEMETFEAPNLTQPPNQFAFFNCAKLRSIKFPRINAVQNYFIRQQAVSSVIEEIQLGSIGYPFTTLANNWNYVDNRTGCTITIYVGATTIAEAQTAITNWASYGGQNTSDCTLVFRNSTTGEVITE
jgi:hypothetical protein